MKLIRKFLLSIISVILLTGPISINAETELNNESSNYEAVNVTNEKSFDESNSLMQSPNYGYSALPYLEEKHYPIVQNYGYLAATSLEDEIYSIVDTLKTTHTYISQYNLTVDEFSDIYFGVMNSNPELFYARSFYYYDSGGIITSFRPDYSYDLSAIPSMKTNFKKNADEIYNGAIKSGMTVLDKVLAIHEALALKASYDTKNLNSSTLPEKAYSAYGIITEGLGVCNGYALAFTYFMNRIGVENRFVTSNPMNHAWNLIKLNGYWYHVDVTWDDGSSYEGYNGIDYTYANYVSHRYFLKSDVNIKTNVYSEVYWKPHFGWDTSIPKAVDERYSQSFFNESYMPMFYKDGMWYTCINYDGIYKYNVNTNAKSIILSDSSIEAFYAYNSNIYYVTYASSYDHIMTASMNGTSIKTLVSIPYAYNRYSFASLELSNGKLRYTTNTNESSPYYTINYLTLVKSIALNNTEATIFVGQTTKLSTTFSPTSASIQDVTWKSSDTSVATVDSNGKVKGIKTGTATITATSVEGRRTATSVITVDTTRITTQPKNIIGALNKTYNATVKAVGLELSYQWYHKNSGSITWDKSTYVGATTSSLEVPINSTSQTRTYKCIITDKFGNTVESNIINVEQSIVNIITQPNSITGALNKTYTATIEATGEGLTYQWYYVNAGETTYVKSTDTGATTKTLTLPLNGTTTARKYKCKVTDKYGTSVQSNAISVKQSIITITTQPKTITGSLNKTYTTTVEATGSGLTYQWYYVNAGETTYVKSTDTGATTKTLTLPLNSTTTTRKYKCKITDKYGTSIQTNVISVKESIITISTQPKNIVGAMNKTYTTSVEATGNGLIYQWYYVNAGETTYVKSTDTGASTNTLTILLNSVSTSRKYKCEITDKYGSVISTNAITVKKSVIKITAQPKEIVGALNKTYTTTIVATGEGLTYQWYYANAGETVYVKSTDLGAKTNTLTLPIDSVTTSRQYRCIVTDKYGTALKSNSISVKKSVIIITTQPKNITGALNKTYTATIGATGEGLTYQWYYVNAGETTYVKSTDTGATTKTLTLPLNSTTTARKYKCKVTDKYGTSVQSNAISVKQSIITITTQPKTITGSLNKTYTTTVEATGSGLTYQWYYVNAGETTYVKSTDTGATTNKLTLSVNSVTKSRKYKCKITDKYGTSIQTNAISVKEN